MSAELGRLLRKEFKNFRKTPTFEVGQQNDAILQSIIKNIRRSPDRGNFIQFTNTLNFFYSTRLQANVNSEKRHVKDSATVICTVSEILARNWQEGICLEKVPRAPINCEKVERLRQLLHHRMGMRAYSFATKVFHQLNDRYPILDSNIKEFMTYHQFNQGMDFTSRIRHRSYEDFVRAYMEMAESLGWSENEVNTLDLAIWAYISKSKKLKESSVLQD